MRTETRPTNKTQGEWGGWFLRLARQRRWFHESLFREPVCGNKPGRTEQAQTLAVCPRKPRSER